jgi:hypothetical protein
MPDDFAKSRRLLSLAVRVEKFMFSKKVIYLIFIYLSCHTIGDQKFNDHYLPDLKIKNVKSKYIAQEIPKPPPGRPVSSMHGLIDMEFDILIENFGSGDWKNDLCITYTFEGEGKEIKNSIMFENLIIPYASSQEVNFIVKNIFFKPNSVIFIINVNKIDSVGCGVFSEEIFYNNNTYKYNLSK